MENYKIKPEGALKFLSTKEIQASRPKVMIGLPCYGGNMTVETSMGLIEMGQLAVASGIKVDFYYIANESLVSRARNSIVAHFLTSKENYTHLMWVDVDTSFSGSYLFKMLHYDVDWVAGAVSTKALPIRHVIEPHVDEGGKVNISEGKELVELGMMGGAFNLMKRRVYEEMVKGYPECHCSRQDDFSKFVSHNIPDGENMPKEEAFEYFKSFNLNFYSLYDTGHSSKLGLFTESEEKWQKKAGLPKDAYLSEDYTFARRWRKIGGKIWLDPRMMLGHIGRFEYVGNPMLRFPKEFWTAEDLAESQRADGNDSLSSVLASSSNIKTGLDNESKQD